MRTKCSLASTRCLFCGTCHLLHCEVAAQHKCRASCLAAKANSGSMARALKPFRLLDGTTKAFCYGGGGCVGALISWQKAQKSFRTTPQKPNSLKRSAQAVVPPFPAHPPLHTYSNSGRANTTMNNRTISTLHGSPQRERERKKGKKREEEGKGNEKGRKTQTLTQSCAELSLSQVQKKRAKKN